MVSTLAQVIAAQLQLAHIHIVLIQEIHKALLSAPYPA